jgi:hypothetical protein
MIIFLLIELLLFGSMNAAVHPCDSINKNGWKDLKAREVLKLSARDLAKISGQKMNLKEKILFRISKINIRKGIREDPDLSYAVFLSTQHKISTFALVMIAVVSLATLFVIAGTKLSIGTWLH